MTVASGMPRRRASGPDGGETELQGRDAAPGQPEITDLEQLEFRRARRVVA